VAILYRNEVEIFLVGGLGNQLFGWAAGASLAKKLGCKLTVNTSQLSSRRLAIPENVLAGATISEKEPIYYRNNSKLFKRIYRNLPLNRTYFEREYSFENRFNGITHPVKLDGFFQSRDYFCEFKSEILDLLNDQENLTTEYKRIRTTLPDQYISIHFRRGDYVTNSDFHPLATKQYYEKALSRVSDLGIDLKKVIFTDDESLARKEFPTDLILSQKDLAAPFDNMYLMSEGAAIIGANSSFSLWAAFLRRTNGETCIFPNRWFGKGFMENLTPVPPEFIRI
jgi:hypothetical protein